MRYHDAHATNDRALRGGRGLVVGAAWQLSMLIDTGASMRTRSISR
jgi:hypothetical protein